MPSSGAAWRNAARHLLGAVVGHQPGQRHRARAECLHRGADAAAHRIAEQRAHRCGAGHADADRQRHPAFAQARGPVEHQLAVEAELRHDEQFDAVRLGIADLAIERVVERLLRNPAMPLRIAGDADTANPAGLEHAGFEHLQARRERARRRFAVAGDQQDALDAGLVAQSRREVGDRGGAGEAARRQVRDRVQSGLAQPRGGAQDVVVGRARQEGHVDVGAGRQPLRVAADVGDVAGRRLDRRGARQPGDRTAELGRAGSRRFARCVLGFHGLGLQSRCREMMYDSSWNHSPSCLRSTSPVTSR